MRCAYVSGYLRFQTRACALPLSAGCRPATVIVPSIQAVRKAYHSCGLGAAPHDSPILLDHVCCIHVAGLILSLRGRARYLAETYGQLLAPFFELTKGTGQTG